MSIPGVPTFAALLAGDEPLSLFDTAFDSVESWVTTYFAAVGGSASTQFLVANATPGSNGAVNIAQADARYAALAGDAAQPFLVRDATAPQHAVSLTQAQGLFTPIGYGVPYTGATTDADLGAHKLTASSLVTNGGLKFTGTFAESALTTHDTYFQVRPSSGATISGFYAYNANDTANAGYVSLLMEPAVSYFIVGKNGSGSYVPLTFAVGNDTVATFGTDQKITIPKQLISTQATGTAPFVIASTTLVPNLTTGGNALLAGASTQDFAVKALTAAGNAAIGGSVISPWQTASSGTAAIQMGKVSFAAVADAVAIGNNTYRDAVGPKAIATGVGTRYIMNAGSHLFQYAASVVADAAQTFVSSLSIDTSGNLTSLGNLLSNSATAIPAGGTTGIGHMFSSTADFGVFFGSSTPTLSAAKGSLYLRSDGTNSSTRAYINTDGGTTWTAITTAA